MHGGGQTIFEEFHISPRCGPTPPKYLHWSITQSSASTNYKYRGEGYIKDGGKGNNATFAHRKKEKRETRKQRGKRYVCKYSIQATKTPLTCEFLVSPANRGPNQSPIIAPTAVSVPFLSFRCCQYHSFIAQRTRSHAEHARPQVPPKNTFCSINKSQL